MELHGIRHDERPYHELHTLMDGGGLHRWFGRERFELPPAEYVGGPETEFNTGTMANSVFEMAKHVKPPFGASVIVSKWGTFGISGKAHLTGRNPATVRGQFVVRAELHGEEHDAGKYVDLHALMKSEQFEHTVPGPVSPLFLPSAEYIRTDLTATAQGLADELHGKVVQELKPKEGATVVVTSAVEFAHRGLEPAIFHTPPIPSAALGAYSGHRDQRDRSIVIAAIGAS